MSATEFCSFVGTLDKLPQASFVVQTEPVDLDRESSRLRIFLQSLGSPLVIILVVARISTISEARELRFAPFS